MKYYERNKYRCFIHVHAYAYLARLRRGRFLRNQLVSLDVPEKYKIIVQKSPN